MLLVSPFMMSLFFCGVGLLFFFTWKQRNNNGWSCDKWSSRKNAEQATLMLLFPSKAGGDVAGWVVTLNTSYWLSKEKTSASPPFPSTPLLRHCCLCWDQVLLYLPVSPDWPCVSIAGALTEEALTGHVNSAPCVPTALCFLAPVNKAGPNTVQPHRNYSISLWEVVLCPQATQKCCKLNIEGLKSRKNEPWPWIRQRGWHSGQTDVCGSDYHGKMLPG